MSDNPLLPSQEDKAAVAEIFADLRDRKFLKYLFNEEPENCGAYGYIERPFDAEVQAEIAEAWAAIIARHAASSRDQGRREGRDETAWLVEEDVGGFCHYIALSEDQWPRTKVRTVGSARRFETEKYETPVRRVKDANEALRFARKEDAEAFIKLFDRFLLIPKAAEHMWPSNPRPTGEGEDLEQQTIELLATEIAADPTWQDAYRDRETGELPTAEEWRVRASGMLTSIRAIIKALSQGVRV